MYYDDTSFSKMIIFVVDFPYIYIFIDIYIRKVPKMQNFSEAFFLNFCSTKKQGVFLFLKRAVDFWMQCQKKLGSRDKVDHHGHHREFYTAKTGFSVKFTNQN